MYLDGDSLSERKKMILKAIIDLHIKHGEPVGSKFLVSNNNIQASSATIRNEMAELEDLGYLEQPHTSAGRVPSELGYRFYVNSLMQKYRLTQSELEELDNLRMAKARELDKILEQAGKLVSRLTNYTSLMVKSKPDSVAVRSFKLIRNDWNSLILIMIISDKDVKTRYIRTFDIVNDSDVFKVEEMLNRYVSGVPVENITVSLIRKMELEAGSAEFLITPIVKAIYDTVEEIDGGDIHVEGLNTLLNYSEYSDREELSGLLGLSDNKESIINAVNASDKNAINIYIGKENPLQIMKNSTMIFRTIVSDGKIVGAIGVIGPRRMEYNKVISTIDYMSQNIAGIIDGEDTDKDGK